jgi:acylphosphatase
VQGVGFRAFVRDLAEDREITGEVWNCYDRSVELTAFHDDASVLIDFASALRNGPGRVDSVESRPYNDSATESFEIGFTR